ncbi:hypothetical protein AVEN_136393-1, partial [Araneus ventricosus]
HDEDNSSPHDEDNSSLHDCANTNRTILFGYRKRK